ncbi:MAG: hypothetical protein JXX14_05940, partial [Deltaproteobacteria bacterium]|nr:hypothetical protein [Deltaproteobacteria bacterium]
MKAFSSGVLFVALITVSIQLAAASWTQTQLPPKEIPRALEAWVAWSKSEIVDYQCRHFACIWPGTLNLEFTSQGGTFALSVDVLTQSTVQLPGDEQIWPVNVRVSNNAAVVGEDDGTPAVML